MLQHFNFKHDESDLVDALGLPQRDYEVAKMTIKYEFLAPLVLAADDETLIKVTGETVLTRSQILEKTLKRLEGSVSQQLLTLYVFNNTYDGIKTALKTLVQKFEEFSDMEDKSSHRVEAESISDALQQIESIMKIKPVMAAVEFLSKAKCSYSKFIAFTVDDVSFEDALAGKTEPSEEDLKRKDKMLGKLDDLLGDLAGKKKSKKKKSYDDIDEIIKRALEGEDEENN